MAWDRLELKNIIKLSQGLSTSREDGLLTDAIIHTAIERGMKRVAEDCNIMPIVESFPLVANQWVYPIPETLLKIIEMWRLDTGDVYQPMDFVAPDKLILPIDPTEDLGDPTIYSYPYFQRPIHKFWVGAPLITDFVNQSYVTTATKRTVIDSAVNFGKIYGSGRIRPGDLVRNNTDKSYGYVDYLEMSTLKASGTTKTNTDSSSLYDTAKDFVAADVQIDDLIARPVNGKITSYAFVTSVATNVLGYDDMFGAVEEFGVGDTYWVGKATEIRLKNTLDHPGLREGVTNIFNVGSEKASIAGTTFTATRVTGTITGTAEVGDIAIAGSSHGKVTAVESGYLDVPAWYGGIPTAGTAVSVKECDQYQIESAFRTEKVLWLNPTPSASDTSGKKSMVIRYVDTPNLPQRDSDAIEIPEKYFDPLLHACLYYTMLLKGNANDNELMAKEQYYMGIARPYLMDAYKKPMKGPLKPYENRGNVRVGRINQGPSGALWNHY